MKTFDKIRAFSAAAVIASLCMTCPAFAEVNSAEGKPVQISPAYNPDSGESPAPVENAGQSADPFSAYPYGTGLVAYLTEYWEENGYPDYVSYAGQLGIASYDVNTQTESVYGLWTIGVVNATEEQKQEIISLVSSDYHVKFEEANHSYAYRAEQAEKIRQSYPYAVAELSEASENIYVYNDGYTDEEWSKIVSAYEGGIVINGGDYLDQSAGVPEIGQLEGDNPLDGVMKSTNAPSNGDTAPDEYGVDGAAPTVGINAYNGEGGGVSAENIRAEAPVGAGFPADAEIGEGDKAMVTENKLTGGNQEATMLPVTQKKANPIYMWIFICGSAIIIAAAAAFVILRKAKKNALVTTAGNTVTEGAAPTKAEIVKAVRESEIHPDKDDFRKIMEKIEKE